TSTRALPELGRGLVVAVYPGLSIAAALKVDVLLERGRIDEARALAGRFVLVRSGVDYCGQAQERLKDATSRDEIFQGFRRAVLAQPTRAECAWWFGQWLTDEGELRLARAMVVDAESWRAHRNLGLMLGQLQRPAAAELHLRRAVELFGEDIGTRVALARALYAQGKLAEYAAQTRTALKVADAVGQPLPEVREFLEAFERRGAIRALPPTSMPRVALGWNAD